MKKYLLSDALRMEVPVPAIAQSVMQLLPRAGENSAYEILKNEGQLQVSVALPVAA